MARREAAEEAVKDPNPTIDGRRANVNLAYLGAKNRNPTMQRKNRNEYFSHFFSLFSVGYGLLARMPPSYPSAYPFVDVFHVRFKEKIPWCFFSSLDRIILCIIHWPQHNKHRFI